MTTFDEDLVQGQAVENLLKVILETRGNTVTMNDATSLEQLRMCDLVVVNQMGYKYGIEVKYDRMCTKTGNVAVEIQALNHSSADYYAYYLDTKFYIFSKLKMESMCSNPNMYFRKCFGGDGMRSDLRLFKMDKFTKEAIYSL